MEVLRGVPQQQQGRIPHKEQTLSPSFVFVEETPNLGGGSLGFPLKVLNKRQNPCGISQALTKETSVFNTTTHNNANKNKLHLLQKILHG